MRIKLHNHYRNVSGADLKPGFYDSEAGDISGHLANYLVENGHAEDVTPITAPAKAKAAEPGNAVNAQPDDPDDPQVGEGDESVKPQAAPTKGKGKK